MQNRKKTNSKLEMKLVKENINEKFVKDSDPIHDMGIGIINIWEKLKHTTFGELNKKYFPTYSPYSSSFNPGFILEDIFLHVFRQLKDGVEQQTAFDKAIKIYIRSDVDQKLILKRKKIVAEVLKEHFGIIVDVNNKIHESLNEKFKEDSDPIHDMGIGIIKWENLKPGNVFMLKKKFWDHQVLLPTYYRINSFTESSFDDRKDNIHINYSKFDSKEDLLKNKSGVETGNWRLTRDFFEDHMKIVQNWELNEKFEEDSDPIHDMGIGIAHNIKNCVEHMFDIDIKNHYIVSARKGLGNMNHITVRGNMFKMNYYSNEYLDSNNKKLDIKKYYISLLEKVNIFQCFEDNIIVDPSNYSILFTIKPQFIKYFENCAYDEMDYVVNKKTNYKYDTSRYS